MFCVPEFSAPVELGTVPPGRVFLWCPQSNPEYGIITCVKLAGAGEFVRVRGVPGFGTDTLNPTTLVTPV